MPEAFGLSGSEVLRRYIRASAKELRRLCERRLEVDLQSALDERSVDVSWPDLAGDLKQLQAVRMQMNGRNYLIRTDLVGSAYQAFMAAGVKIPPRVQPIGMVSCHSALSVF